ncbi:hypothetical protein B0H12DRAFT_1081586 [Mycena haematopus]|nr:hypothetical protein B0H12DRAFT_1081586 [Mycena haematopus]
MEHLTPQGQDRPIIPPEFRTLDNLYSHYAMLMDTTIRSHLACAKYLLSYRNALSTNPSKLGLERRADGFRDGLGAWEVQISVLETLGFWDEAASALSGNFLSIPGFWEFISCVAPDYAFVRQQTLIADFPSLQMKGQQNLHDVVTAYMGLAAINRANRGRKDAFPRVR